MSMAMTGFFYQFRRPRTSPPMSMLKYDPVGTSAPRVLRPTHFPVSTKARCPLKIPELPGRKTPGNINLDHDEVLCRTDLLTLVAGAVRKKVLFLETKRRGTSHR